MVRRRRNQRDAFGGVTQTRDQVRDLHPRKLTTFAGLGTLSDLDLKLFALVQVFGGHAETARCDLLDLGRRVVAVRLRHEMRRVFAALTGVRLGADPVHRDVQRLVRFGRQSAQAHAGGHEPFADRGDRFHLFDRNRFAQRFDVEHVAQMDRRVRLHPGRILLPHLVGRPVAGRLHQVHGLCTPSVRLAVLAGFVEAADGQNVLPQTPAFCVDRAGFLLDTTDADAGDTAGHAGEVVGDHRAAQTHGFEVQTATIGRNDRDTHLGHDLEQTLIHGLAILANGIGQAAFQQAALDPVGKAVFGEIGVHHRRTRRDQHREVMRVDALGRPHVERGEGAQSLARQPRMHGRGGKDHRHPHLVLVLCHVRQNDVPGTRPHGLFRLVTDASQTVAQRLIATVRREGAVDVDAFRVEVLEQLLELRVADERAFQHEDLGLASGFVQHVLEVAEPGLEAHDPEFAKRVDRRVRHLAEVLAEEVAQGPVFVRQHRRRRVVTHRRQRFLPVLGHRREDLFQLFKRVAGGHLTAAQIGPGMERLFFDAQQFLVDVVDLADPVAERLAVGEFVLDLDVVVELALFHIDGEQLTGAKRAFLDAGRLVHRDHARLGPGDHQPITRHDIAHRAQAVAVQTRADPAPIGHGQRGGAVPRLHRRVGVGIHIHPRLRHLRRLLGPRFRHQHRLGHRRGPSGAHQNFEHRIQRRTVRRTLRHDRLDVLGQIPERARGHADLVALHPVEVALQRVDLAVVGEHPEGLRQPPLREGVGRIALVIDRECAFEPLVFQVRVELRHLLGQHHALVDDRPARQRGEVKLAHTCGGGGFFDPAADDVKLTLECLFVHALGVRDQDLFDLGPGRVGFFAKAGDIHRHVTPAVDVIAHAQDFGLDDGPARLLRAEVGARQEHLTDRDHLFLARLVAGAADLIVEELNRNLHVDARAVAGLAVGIHRAPVPDRLQRLDARFHDLAAFLAVDRHDEAHAARGVFELFAVHPMFGKVSALGFFLGHPAFVKFGHGRSPQAPEWGRLARG